MQNVKYLQLHFILHFALSEYFVAKKELLQKHVFEYICRLEIRNLVFWNNN